RYKDRSLIMLITLRSSSTMQWSIAKRLHGRIRQDDDVPKARNHILLSRSSVVFKKTVDQGLGHSLEQDEPAKAVTHQDQQHFLFALVRHSEVVLPFVKAAQSRE